MQICNSRSVRGYKIPQIIHTLHVKMKTVFQLFGFRTVAYWIDQTVAVIIFFLRHSLQTTL